MLGGPICVHAFIGMRSDCSTGMLEWVDLQTYRGRSWVMQRGEPAME